MDEIGRSPAKTTSLRALHMHPIALFSRSSFYTLNHLLLPAARSGLRHIICMVNAISFTWLTLQDMFEDAAPLFCEGGSPHGDHEAVPAVVFSQMPCERRDSLNLNEYVLCETCLFVHLYLYMDTWRPTHFAVTGATNLVRIGHAVPCWRPWP